MFSTCLAALLLGGCASQPGWPQPERAAQLAAGTGDAAMVGLSAFPGDDLDDSSTVIVLPGDMPMMSGTLPTTSAATISAQRMRS